MRKSRGLNLPSSALYLVVVLGAGSAQTCPVSLRSVASGAALCLGDVYADVLASKDLQATVASGVAEYGLPRAASGLITNVTAAALVHPRIAEVLGFVHGSLGCIFTKASIKKTADAVWAKVKTFFEAHCKYVAPLIGECLRNVSQPRTCHNSTSYITEATNSLLGMYCNTNTWKFKESLSAGLANEMRQVIGSICSGSKVSPIVSAPIFADLRKVLNLVGDVASGGNFSAADIVGLLVSSPVNSSLSTLDLSSLPGLARNSSQDCKSQLPYVLSQMLGLPSDSPLLASVGSLCKGLMARVQNASTPEQLVFAASTMVKDAMAAVSNAASVKQVTQALTQIAFGADAAGNLTAVANVSQRAVAPALANVMTRAGTHDADKKSAIVSAITSTIGVSIGGELAFDQDCRWVAELAREIRTKVEASLTANSGNLTESEFVLRITRMFVKKNFKAIRQSSCSPAVVAYVLQWYTPIALFVSRHFSPSDQRSDAFVYALLTGLQNSTRALTDLAGMTGLSSFLNSTLLHLNNVTAIAAQANQLAMAAAGQFAPALSAQLANRLSELPQGAWIHAQHQTDGMQQVQ